MPSGNITPIDLPPGRGIICDSRSRQHYDQLRAAGHHHARAVRGLADRLLGLLIAMLKNGERYDSTRRMPLDPPAPTHNP